MSGERQMRWLTVATTSTFLVLATHPAPAHQQEPGQRQGLSPRTSCVIEVLYSEELPGAPIFQSLVRARLRITPPGQPPFERTVERFIPWQAAPPRRGQRLMVSCDPASLEAPVPY